MYEHQRLTLNASFGIDHPLIAVHNIELLRDKFIAMGFNMTAVGKHPWGTSTSLAMFNGCLIELMGIYDATLIDEVPAGKFRFGRHVYEHLQRREGVALTALHSTDSITDAKHAEQAGLTVAGHLEFGRDVTLPDGDSGRTKTTLALLPNTQWPRLSFFLCQQHKPELIYVPQWLEHPNTVCGIAGILIWAEDEHHETMCAQLGHLYGGVKKIPGGFSVDTANGPMQVKNSQAIGSEYGPLPVAVVEDNQPGIVSLDLHYKEESALLEYLQACDIEFHSQEHTHTLSSPEETANLYLRFNKKR